MTTPIVTPKPREPWIVSVVQLIGKNKILTPYCAGEVDDDDIINYDWKHISVSLTSKKNKNTYIIEITAKKVGCGEITTHVIWHIELVDQRREGSDEQVM